MHNYDYIFTTRRKPAHNERAALTATRRAQFKTVLNAKSAVKVKYHNTALRHGFVGYMLTHLKLPN